MTVKIFFHICAMRHAPELVQEYVTIIHFSGLYDIVSEIRCCLCGDDPQLLSKVKEVLKAAGKKFVIALEAPGDKTYERLTLMHMHNHLGPDDHGLYIHSKSVSYEDPDPREKTRSWARMMLYQLVKNWRKCLVALEMHDAVGCNYHNNGGLVPYHFSGNFWWVRGDYYAKLPRYIAPDYYAPEFYITAAGPRVHVIYDSNTDHKKVNYGYDKYVD